MMSKCRVFLLLAVLLFPIVTHAQKIMNRDVDEYVEELNAMCPIEYKDDWAMNSLTMVEDRYALVDIQLPSNLSMFLSTLTTEGDNVKRLWIKQLKDFGERWKRFVDLMVKADRRICVSLRPKGSDETALITLLPTDFNPLPEGGD